MDKLLSAMRRIMEQPKINTWAALQLTMKINELDCTALGQLGIFENGEWLPVS